MLLNGRHFELYPQLVDAFRVSTTPERPFYLAEGDDRHTVWVKVTRLVFLP